MNSQKLKFSFICSVFVLILTLNSCVKESPIQPTADPVLESNFTEITTATPALASDISLQNGVLAFKSVDDFRSTLLALNRMTTKEQLQWEEQIGFISMKQIFDEIIAAEFETPGAHSDLYTVNLQSGLIVTDEITGLYKLNVFNPAYASVLNKKGLVLVENDVYQFAGDALKIWENGDIKHPEILQDAKSSTDEIQVIPMNFQEVVLRNTTNWNDQCESGDDSGMLNLSAFYNSDYPNPGHPEVIFIDFYLTALSLVIDANDEWQYDPNAVVKLKGKFEIQFTVTDGTIERIRRMMRSYDQLLGYGGAFTFLLNESGNYNFGAPWTFVNPANLMRAAWVAQNKLGNGSSFSCGLYY